MSVTCSINIGKSEGPNFGSIERSGIEKMTDGLLRVMAESVIHEFAVWEDENCGISAREEIDVRSGRRHIWLIDHEDLQQ
jgi:hypothetical protein